MSHLGQPTSHNVLDTYLVVDDADLPTAQSSLVSLPIKCRPAAQLIGARSLMSGHKMIEKASRARLPPMVPQLSRDKPTDQLRLLRRGSGMRRHLGRYHDTGLSDNF
jgi:hypothetical protein